MTLLVSAMTVTTHTHTHDTPCCINSCSACSSYYTFLLCVSVFSGHTFRGELSFIAALPPWPWNDPRFKNSQKVNEFIFENWKKSLSRLQTSSLEFIMRANETSSVSGQKVDGNRLNCLLLGRVSEWVEFNTPPTQYRAFRRRKLLGRRTEHFYATIYWSIVDQVPSNYWRRTPCIVLGSGHSNCGIVSLPSFLS